MPPPDSAPALNPEPAKTPHDSSIPPTGRTFGHRITHRIKDAGSFRAPGASRARQQTTATLRCASPPPLCPPETNGMGLRGPPVVTLSVHPVHPPDHGDRSVRIVHFRTNHEQGCSGQCAGHGRSLRRCEELTGNSDSKRAKCTKTRSPTPAPRGRASNACLERRCLCDAANRNLPRRGVARCLM